MTSRSPLLTAARNAWAISWFGDGVESYRGLPQTVVYDEPHRQLRRFDRTTPSTGNPVLLVPPLAVAADCYDLRPGQSLAAHLLETGRQAYVIDYGDITFADRHMGFEDWIRDIVPTAVRRVSAEHDGARVDVVAWSLGGTISLLTAGANPDLPIDSITCIGTPIDYTKLPGLPLLRAIDRRVGSRVMTAPTRLLGGAPALAVQVGFRATAPVRELTKPWYLLRNLTDTEALARVEAIDSFMDRMPGYPGRLYHQIHTRLMMRLELVKGTVRLSEDCVVDLANVKPRVLLVGSATDAIAPGPAVEAGVRALPGAVSVRYAAVDGMSHLGMVAAPDAHRRSWPIIDAFLAE